MHASSHNRVGLVLGGGGARGFAHIGVMRVLEREGFKPYCFAGTSMGGLLGAFYAAGLSTADLEALLERLQLVRFLDLNPLAEALNRVELRRLLEQHLPETFADLKHPFCVTATDLISGKSVYFSDGNLSDALLCTIAFPGAIDPSWVGDALLADGGILNQIPVGAVRVLGARQVLAVDVTPLEPLSLAPQDKPARWWERMFGRDRQLSTIQALLRATDIMQSQITRSRMALVDPDGVIQVEMPGLTVFSFNRMAQAIAAGERAAEEHLEQLRRVFTGTLQTQM